MQFPHICAGNPKKRIQEIIGNGKERKLILDGYSIGEDVLTISNVLEQPTFLDQARMGARVPCGGGGAVLAAGRSFSQEHKGSLEIQGATGSSCGGGGVLEDFEHNPWWNLSMSHGYEWGGGEERQGWHGRRLKEVTG